MMYQIYRMIDGAPYAQPEAATEAEAAQAWESGEAWRVEELKGDRICRSYERTAIAKVNADNRDKALTILRQIGARAYGSLMKGIDE
jgi:hypothetical protein